MRKTLILLLLLNLFSCSKSDSTTENELNQQFTVSILAGEGGTVDVGGGNYTIGTLIQVTATPNEGYTFDIWSDGNQENPRTIIVKNSIEISANFTPIPIYLSGNGITIKASNRANIGETWELDGTEYIVVDEELLREMISNAEDISKVVTTRVTNMRELFLDYSFEEEYDISSWDVSNVVDMGGMFASNDMENGNTFNGDIGAWDVSNVENMSAMFVRAKNFNQNIGSWNVSSVKYMSSMFSEAISFNQDIGNWDLSSALEIKGMFNNATSFNQDIGNWDVSSVELMSSVFNGASSFNQDISNWNISNVESLYGLFARAVSFNQDLKSWDVSNITRMGGMFYEAASFNQNLSSWDVSNVLDMEGMFWSASSFNQDLSSWNVSKVENCASFSTNTPNWDKPKPDFANCNQ